ncbi:MAG: M20/M25/M40 family metallo-hydrolase [Sulfurospirillaceae bacterium]|nr:M20/M25/M40 family metallo-hydrolase [Sulfurospirillaceae bacterium]
MENELKQYFSEHEDEFFMLFKKIIEINSYSYNKAGIDKVLDTIKSYLGTSFDYQTIESDTYGNLLRASTPAVKTKNTQIMLCGHMDTVFPQDAGFLDYTESDGIIKGPGVFDMKGGLLIGIMTLKFLEHKNLLKKIPVTFFFNSDEEIGSPFSKPYIETEAKRSAAAFVLEGAGHNGEIVTGRKGKIGASLECFGEAGHAAFKIAGKKSAILELAHKIIEIENINDTNTQISANVGKISGGVGPNTISDYAKATIDIRFTNSDDEKNIKQKLAEIDSMNFVDGVTSKLEITSGRGSMEESTLNLSFYEDLKNIIEGYNVKFGREFRGGVSDANAIANVNTPVLDGFGPIGADDHSRNEFIEKDSIIERFIILTVSLLRVFETKIK